METMTIEIDEQVLKRMGRNRIQRYIDKMISMEKMENFTLSFKDRIGMSEAEYMKKLEEVRQAAWDSYKTTLPITLHDK